MNEGIISVWHCHLLNSGGMLAALPNSQVEMLTPLCSPRRRGLEEGMGPQEWSPEDWDLRSYKEILASSLTASAP